jgi:hypothetical protein
MTYSLFTLSTRPRAKVQSLVFYSRSGSLMARRRIIHIKNPRTFLQEENRKSMIHLVEAYKVLKPLLLKSLNTRPVNLSVYNYFIKKNLNHSIVNGTWIPQLISFSNSDFSNTQFSILRYNQEPTKFLITWEQTPDPEHSDSDLLFAVLFNFNSFEFQFKITNTIRSARFAKISFNPVPLANKIFLYLFFVDNRLNLSGETSIYEF